MTFSSSKKHSRNPKKNQYGVSGEVLFFFPHGSTHSKGVSILINPLRTLNVKATGKDPDRSIVPVDLIYSSSRISICNVYVPNDCQQQQKLLLNLNRYLVSNTEILLSLQAMDKKGGVPWRPTLHCDKLVSIMDHISLIDIFIN